MVSAPGYSVLRVYLSKQHYGTRPSLLSTLSRVSFRHRFTSVANMLVYLTSFDEPILTSKCFILILILIRLRSPPPEERDERRKKYGTGCMAGYEVYYSHTAISFFFSHLSLGLPFTTFFVLVFRQAIAVCMCSGLQARNKSRRTDLRPCSDTFHFHTFLLFCGVFSSCLIISSFTFGHLLLHLFRFYSHVVYYAYLALYGPVWIEARHVFARDPRIVFIDRQDNILRRWDEQHGWTSGCVHIY